MLETLYSTGMRRAELARLAVADLDVERGTVLIREGKCRKDRVVPIGERALLWTAAVPRRGAARLRGAAGRGPRLPHRARQGPSSPTGSPSW